ncbi:metallophosphoesterase family protein [bacterium]|nr:metallophosphoesterase family protein [Akkermansiaceae bacterium]MDA8961650.1 metallophosphoesterase family protein [bacterium]MDA7537449.1 metallophosphoesterase family protein [Akkermansiaceae bacterium]MDA7613016.1 metallophosphoesterase family protein [Akkermansiaceae bacterium]MDA7646592.1 metallophosphoesterase family protein [Akkermansiaceae bacterium]
MDTLDSLSQKISLGVIADLHVDLIPDGAERLDSFLDEMTKTKPDALIQMGDFSFAKESNQKIVDRFNKAHEIALHVIGNHDTDGGLSMEHVLKSWGMKDPYYHHVVEGLHLLVLNANEKGSVKHKGGYPKFIGKSQVAWLGKMLSSLEGPVVIVSHQPIAGSYAIDNAAEIQKILSKHSDKVVLAMNGHTHIDLLTEVGEIPYLHINSASYHWLGSKYAHESYPAEVHAKHSALKYTSPYREALFTTLTFEPKNRQIIVEKRVTQWVGKSPEELGLKREPEGAVTPGIRARVIGKK